MPLYRFSFSENSQSEDYAVREFPSLEVAATKESVKTIWPDIWCGSQVSVVVTPCDSESGEGMACVERHGVEVIP